MKPLKDKFSIIEIKKSEQRIIDVLKNYCSENNLAVFWSQYCPHNVSLNYSYSNSSSHMSNKTDYKYFFDWMFTLCDSEEQRTSHNIFMIDEPLFYKKYFCKLSTEDKIIFIKTASRHTDRTQTITNIANLSDDDFWLHLRHFVPFSKSSKQTYMFKSMMDAVTNRSVDDDFKAQSLMQFFHYYKPIIKRTDIKNSVYRYIEDKVDKKYHSDFEKFLSFKIGEQVNSDSYASISNNLCVISLDKEEIFKSLPFKQIPNADVYTYNYLIETIKNIITNEQSNELGVEHVVVQELCSKKTPGKIYIESSENGFKVDMLEYFKLMMKVGADNLTKNNSQDMKKLFSDALNYLKISKELNSDSENCETKVKRLKI